MTEIWPKYVAQAFPPSESSAQDPPWIGLKNVFIIFILPGIYVTNRYKLLAIFGLLILCYLTSTYITNIGVGKSTKNVHFMRSEKSNSQKGVTTLVRVDISSNNQKVKLLSVRTQVLINLRMEKETSIHWCRRKTLMKVTFNSKSYFISDNDHIKCSQLHNITTCNVALPAKYKMTNRVS